MRTALNKKRYIQLLSEALPRVIRNAKEHEEMLHKVEELMLQGETLSREETEILEILTTLVQDWEQKKFWPKVLN